MGYNLYDKVVICRLLYPTYGKRICFTHTLTHPHIHTHEHICQETYEN